MPIGTRRKGRPTRWPLYLPEELAQRVAALMIDPLTHKPIYGGRSQLVTQLLESWCDAQEAALFSAAQAAGYAQKPASELLNG